MGLFESVVDEWIWYWCHNISPGYQV